MIASVVVYPISPRVVAEAAAPENLPHRHDYQEVVVLTAGRTLHEIDGQESAIAAPSVLLIAQGKIQDRKSVV